MSLCVFVTAANILPRFTELAAFRSIEITLFYAAAGGTSGVNLRMQGYGKHDHDVNYAIIQPDSRLFLFFDCFCQLFLLDLLKFAPCRYFYLEMRWILFCLIILHCVGPKHG